ncbi:MAG: chloride channel protein [Pseudomonadota bacterium]|nr:chloride channel protein [Pseudomonadota bacterium]
MARRIRFSTRRLASLLVADPARWRYRLVLMGAASAAGLAVVLLNRLGDLALEIFHALAQRAWWLPLIWMPACALLVLWLTRTLAPGAVGSGIPQVLSALDAGTREDEIARFVSLRLAFAKLVLTALGLLGGLSLGREGPSVQVAAGVMHGARTWLPARRPGDRNALLVAGGAAGIAAAFNAPLAGVMFAIEELSRTPEQRNSGLLVTAIVFSGLIGIALQGNASYFGVIHAQELTLSLLLPALSLCLAAGVLGGLFSRLMVVAASDRHQSLVIALRRQHPYAFVLGCALAIATIGLLTDGTTFGSGYRMTRAALDGVAGTAGSLTFFKFVATWLTTLCPIPGGIFAPSLSIGASLGNELALLEGVAPHTPLIAIGMVAFLAAVTQAPMTAFIVVMEMVDDHHMIFSLMAAALIAVSISRQLSPSLYRALSRAQLRELRATRQSAVAVSGATLPSVRH